MRLFGSAQVLTLQAGHRLALTLEVLEKEPTLGGPPVSGAHIHLATAHCARNASVQLVTKRGEKITIKIRPGDR